MASNFGSSKNPSGIPSVESLSCRGSKLKKEKEKLATVSVSTKMPLPCVAYHPLTFLKYYLLYGYIGFSNLFTASQKKMPKYS